MLLLIHRPKFEDTYAHDRVFSKFMKQFIDDLDYAWLKGELGRNSKAKINLRLASIVPDLSKEDLVARLKWISQLKLNLKNIRWHLQGHSKTDILYYCSKPYPSKLHFPCLDIDPVDRSTITLTQLNQVRDYLLLIFPGSYYDYGSSGKSLHFYIAIDTNSFWDRVFIDLPVKVSYADLINGLLIAIKDCIKSNLEAVFPFITLCNIKGTLGDYSVKKNKYLTSVIKSGSLCKLPLPRSISEFHRLYNMTLFSFLDILVYFLSAPNFFSYISNQVHSLINIESLFPKTYLSAHTLASPLGQQDVWLTPSYVYPVACREISNIDKHIGAHTPGSEVKESSEKGTDNNITIDNTNSYKDYRQENNAFVRSRDYGFEYFRKFYQEQGREPNFDEYRTAYREDAGTGEETPENYERLKREYDYIHCGFDPSKIGKKDWYEVGEFLPSIQITDEEIQALNKGRYDRPVTKQDIDLAAGFYFSSLIQSLEQKKLFMREFSIAQNIMVGFFKNKKQQGLTDRGCNKHKVPVLRDILIQMGWLVCVDDSYSNGFRSRRYVLGQKHPRYNDFVKVVGIDLINKWMKIIPVQGVI